MGAKLTLSSLFVYTEDKKKAFYTTFGNAVNIVHGRNTSGKSTLFQSIMYSMGINDGQVYLKDILDEKVIFRLDCIVEKNSKRKPVIFIRDQETLFVKIGDCPIERFNGISADQSREHIKLKDFISDLFDFTLKLESKDEYKPAPIEAMWLPYYISQAVGWVYLRKSFSNLEFYRNFKTDYNDYYFGVEQDTDRSEKQRLESLLKIRTEELSLLKKIEKNDEEIQLTKLKDEHFLKLSNEYLEEHAKLTERLRNDENDYVLKCNELEYYEQRKVVLNKVTKNHVQQNPLNGKCPTCSQNLPFDISESYIFFQDENDTAITIQGVKEKIKEIQSKINSLDKKIREQKEEIKKRFSTLNRYYKEELTYESWLKDKANVQLIESITNKLGQLHLEINGIEEDLKGFRTEDDVKKDRESKDRAFANVFEEYLRQLNVKPLIEQRHTQVYQISSFPFQGVELHKTVMAYHFSFNKVIKESRNVHRFPFMLDAIFKEDIEAVNKRNILEFISKNRPLDTQLVFSVAESNEDTLTASGYNNDFFNGQAKLINIGNSLDERAFLSDFQSDYATLLAETFAIINGDETAKA